MTVEVAPEVLETRWEAWRLQRNLRAMRTLISLVAALYPTFGILDWLVAPRASLPVLYASRVLVTVVTLSVFPLLKTEFFARQADRLAGAYVVFISAGIGVMVREMGGYASPYYAGLNLIIVATGILFLWPSRLAVVVNGTVTLCYLLPNVPRATASDLLPAVTSCFFLFSTAIIAATSQSFAYRNARREMENQIRLEQTTELVTKTNQELQQLDQFKSRFFANITHELRTPLAMILSPTELMIEGEFGPVTEPQRATLRSVHRNGARLLRLIGDLLDLSRLEESRLRLRLNEVDLVAFLRGLADQVAPLTERKEITTRFSADVPKIAMWFDAERMERVFVNLLSNAAKFTPVHGEITITLRDESDRVEVSVQDTGSGFPPELADKLFERFYQVSAQSNDNRYNMGGTGIGLALARELVELHGGTIRAESPPGLGARFTVTLRKGKGHFRPEQLDRRARATSVSDDRRSSVDPEQWTQDIALRGDLRFLALADATERRAVERDVDESDRPRTILVVEDTLDVRRHIHMVLRQDYRVLTAPDGKKGFELALRHRPDMLITDLMMPEMDGYELVQLLRKTPQTKHIPVVMLTARGAVDDRIQGIESGVNVYLTKPFAARELRATVRKLMESTDATAERVLTHQMDSLETVTGGLAHEINNPLNYIKNALARIRLDVRESHQMAARLEDPDAKKRLEQLAKRADQMFDVASSGVNRIAGTVSLMGRYSREGYTRASVAHDVFQAARDVVDVVAPAIDRPVKVELHAEGEGFVECVPEELNQLITNLVQNAIEASPDDGTGLVTITGERDGDSVVLKVQDTGPGIKPEDRARIFAPFFTTKAPGRGMGLGLTIVWRVVQSLGGTVTIEGAQGQGAIFVVRLPAASAMASAESAPAAE